VAGSEGGSGRESRGQPRENRAADLTTVPLRLRPVDQGRPGGIAVFARRCGDPRTGGKSRGPLAGRATVGRLNPGYLDNANWPVIAPAAGHVQAGVGD
jgi:hypothetical protein